MAESIPSDQRTLAYLRLETDCREMANRMRDPDLRSHYFRMAEIWLALGEGTCEAETRLT